MTKFSSGLQNGFQPVKRRRALLASNPLRNSRWEADRNEVGATLRLPHLGWMATASPCLGKRPAGITILLNLSIQFISFSSTSSLISTPAGGKRWASRRLPGMKHGPAGIGFMRFGRELSESARSPSSLRVHQVFPGPDEVVREQVPIRLRSWWT